MGRSVIGNKNDRLRACGERFCVLRPVSQESRDVRRRLVCDRGETPRFQGVRGPVGGTGYVPSTGRRPSRVT